MTGYGRHWRFMWVAVSVACASVPQVSSPTLQLVSQEALHDSTRFSLVLDTLMASADPGRDIVAVMPPLGPSPGGRELIQVDTSIESARQRVLGRIRIDSASTELWERCVRDYSGCSAPRPIVAVGALPEADWAFPSLRDDPAVVRTDHGTLLVTRAMVIHPDGGWQTKVFAFTNRNGRWAIAASRLIGVMEGHAPMAPKN